MAPSTLQIKVSSIQRLTKEYNLYKREANEQQKLVDQMEENNADKYELNKQVEVLQESKRMLPEVETRIKQHKKALKDFLQHYEGDEDTSIAEELIQS